MLSAAGIVDPIVKESRSPDFQFKAGEDRLVQVDGLTWHYLQAGAGQPLVLVHGLLGHSFSWRQTLPALAREYEVFAVDLPGSGNSDRPPGDVFLRATSKRLLRFLDALEISRCDMLGTSYGGAVAIMAASLSPKRVERLILAEPVNPWSSHGKLLALFLSNSVIAPVLLRVAPHLGMLQDFYFQRLFGDTRRIRPGSLEGYMRPLLRSGILEHKLRLLRTWNRDLAELRSAIPQVQDIPTLLIWGDQDAAVSLSSAQELKRHFRDCRMLILEGIGHLPYEEAPDEFNRAVLAFLRKLSTHE